MFVKPDLLLEFKKYFNMLPWAKIESIHVIENGIGR